MAAIWFLLFGKSKAMISVRSLGVGISEQGDVLLLQTIRKGDWKSEGLWQMIEKRCCDVITGRIVSAATKAGRLKTILAAAAITGVLSLTAYVFCTRSFPAPPQPLLPMQRDEKPLGQIDGSELLPLGSVFGCNSPAPPPASISVGRSSDETHTPDLSTPAATVYSVLSLIDQTATDKLAPCLFEETGDPVSRLYPRYLGPPVGLREVIENNQSAAVTWEATVHTEFSRRGKRWSPGETITLTARLVRVEGLWKLLQLHEGGEDGP
jgi:hypothetical protein